MMEKDDLTKTKQNTSGNLEKGFWSPMFMAARDVLLASIDKGQFPIALFGIVLGSVVYRLPPDHLYGKLFSRKSRG